MVKRNPYAAYANNKIMMASPAELTLMLYDGAIKFVNIAMDAIDQKDVEKAHNNIRKADLIIEEFQITLNHKYEVAKDFDQVYKYIRERLLWVNVKKDKEILEEVQEHLHTMRDTWKEVMKKTNNGQRVG
jgi:flagellar protein FliS